MGSSDTFSIADATLGTDTDTAIVAVTGEVDMQTAPSFQRGLLRALGVGRNGLVVDLSQASFLDSAALTQLVNAFDHLRRKGGRLIIVASDPRMRTLFEVARLDRDFEIVESREDAINAVTTA